MVVRLLSFLETTYIIHLADKHQLRRLFTSYLRGIPQSSFVHVIQTLTTAKHENSSHSIVAFGVTPWQ